MSSQRQPVVTRQNWASGRCRSDALAGLDRVIREQARARAQPASFLASTTSIRSCSASSRLTVPRSTGSFSISNHRRYRESLDNLTPADAYFGRDQKLLLEREKSNATQSKNVACSIKRKPPKIKPDEPVHPVVHAAICLKLSDDGQFDPSRRFRTTALLSGIDDNADYARSSAKRG